MDQHAINGLLILGGWIALLAWFAVVIISEYKP